MNRLARLGCIILTLFSGLVAAAMDWRVFQRQLLLTGSIIPGDQMVFRANAQLTVHHLGGASAVVLNLPYPPPFLLLSVPFTWLPPLPAYLAWLMAGNLALVAAGRAIRLPWPAIALGLLSPANLYCMVMGQTGMFVSALLVLSLGLMERRPLLAGIAAGGLIIKPQFMLLLPVCFLAGRHLRGAAMAGVTVLFLCALPAAIFGFRVWPAFFIHPVAGGRHLMSVAWPNKFQYTMVTVYMMCRSLGAGYVPSVAAQGVASLAAAALAGRLWRRPGGLARLGILLCLAVLVTPYGYTYDLPGLGLVLAGVALARGGSLAPLALFWVFTGFYVFFSTFWFLTGALFLAAIALLLLRASRVSSSPSWS